MLAVSTGEEAFGAKKSRSGYQPGPEWPPPSPPLEPEPSEPEDVVVVLVVVVVWPEPLPGPEFDPEEPPSWPEVVEVLLLPLLPPLPSVVGCVTTVASPEPSWLLPDEPSPEDVVRPPLPEPDVCEPPPCVRDCTSVE